MGRFLGLIGAAVLALGITACSGSGEGGGGAVDSDEALRGLMQTIALDFAQVLADVAPSNQSLAVKENGATECPEGGGASWTDTGFGGGGTLTLDACRMRGIDVTGTLGGFLESGPDYVDGSMMSGPITVSNGYSAQLNVTNMIVSAQLPIADATTYWEVFATTVGGKTLCAWSGGAGCAPSPF